MDWFRDSETLSGKGLELSETERGRSLDAKIGWAADIKRSGRIGDLRRWKDNDATGRGCCDEAGWTGQRRDRT
jgi:hypothetical protein